jgi:carbon storage regulator
MMIMSRREGETILIGDEIEIVIAHIGRSRVKIGIRAPRELAVVQREVKLVREENLAAAVPASFVAKSRSGELLKFSKTPPKSNLG